MNSTSSEVLLIFVENSTKMTIESWFIPFDIVMVVCSISVIILAMICLFIITFDKTCRTVPMILVGNSCLAILVYESAILGSTLFALENDLKQIQHQDSLCVFRGYMCYVTCAVQNYSFLLQSIYRYLTVVYPTRLFWQSQRVQILFICIAWIIAFVYPMEFLFPNQIIYNLNNQVCQMPLRLSFSVIYMAHCIYIIPVSMIMLIYFKLVRYVKEMSRHVTHINTLLRARRELKMVRRTVILVTILITICFPYGLFIIMSFFNSAPKYHFRIAFVCSDVSLVCVIIALFQFTDPLKASVMKSIKKRSNVVVPAVA